MKKKLYYIYLVILTALVAGCQDEAMFTAEDDGLVTVSYRVKVGDDLQSRAIGDGTQVNNLSVLVLDMKNQFVFRQDNLSWPLSNGLDLTLLRGQYKVLFWLQHVVNNEDVIFQPYSISDDGQVTVSYSDNWSGNITDMEKWDAFYATDDLTIGSEAQTEDIELTRPLGQLNWADEIIQPIESEHQVVVTLSGVATTFNPFVTNSEENVESQSDNYITFTFNEFADETLSANYKEYYYLSCNYLFPVQGLNATFDFQKADETSIKQVEINDGSITIESNKRTNVLGATVLEPEAPAGWDGVTLTQPEPEEGHYIIDEPSDLAWLASENNNLSEAATFLVTENLDMASEEIASVKLPASSTFDGGGYTIKNFANSLFGDATKVSVKNLTVENAVVPTNGVTHVGVLMNTLSGSATFDNVIVTNSTATTTNGAAGGLVGYIKNNDTELLVVNFTKCTATNNTVSGSLTTGVYVGRFRGYDNTETLTFSADCGDSSATIDSNAKASYYITDNAACWFTSAQTTFGKYSGWLGCEEYYRGTINYGAVRYIPKWDGITKIAPLTEGNTKLIYSAFDLANLQEVNGAQITFKSDVDMGTKVFEPIMTATKVYGKKDDSDDNYVIYNLKVDTEFLSGPWYGGAFIRKMTSGSIENITIKNANVSVKNAEGGEDAYASILVATIEGDNVVAVKNVSIDGGYLKGINKIGGIAGYVSCNLQATNCIVSGLTIENSKTSNTGDVFNSYGEVGGLIGLIQGNGSIISSCQVNNCTLNVVTSGLRYNNRFIGTANPSSGQKIIIQTNCSATGNKVTNENKLKYGGFFGIGGKTFDLLGGYSLTLALQGGDVYYGTTKLK